MVTAAAAGIVTLSPRRRVLNFNNTRNEGLCEVVCVPDDLAKDMNRPHSIYHLRVVWCFVFFK